MANTFTCLIEEIFKINSMHEPGYGIKCSYKSPYTGKTKTGYLFMREKIVEEDLKGKVPKPNSLMEFTIYHRRRIGRVINITEQI